MTTEGIKRAAELTLADLSETTGCPPRTIRFYIAKGLLSGPVKAGRGAIYGQAHVQRIGEIREWQAKGLTLTEIARKLAGEQPMRGLDAPAAWWSYHLQSDVIVHVRADASPWRLRQIQRALQEMAHRLALPSSEKEDHEDQQ